MSSRESRHVRKQGTPRIDSATNPRSAEDIHGSRSQNPRSDEPRSQPAPPLNQGLPSRSNASSFGRPPNYEHVARPLVDARTSGSNLVTGQSSNNAPSAQNAGADAPGLLTPLMGDFHLIEPQQYGRLHLFCQRRPEIFEEDLTQLRHAAITYLHRGHTARARRTVQTLVMLQEANGDQAKFLGLLESLQRDDDAYEDFDSQCDTILKDLKDKAGKEKVAEREGGTARALRPVQQDPSARHLIPAPATTLTGGGAVNVGRHSAPSPSISSVVPEVGSRIASTTESGRPRPVVRRGSVAPSDLDTQPGAELQERSGRNPQSFVGPASDVGKNLAKPQKLAYETFSKAFVVHKGDKWIDYVFGRGSVIAVFWHENYGLNLPSKMKGKMEMPTPGRKGPGFVSKVSNGEIVYSHIRRFVVVNQRQGFSTAIPISTYGGRGLSSRAESINETEQLAHTIVYARGTTPIRLEREPVFTKEPICVEVTAADERLSVSSRLYYAKPQSIDHNIKVKHIGHVIKRDVGELMLTYWRENGSTVDQQ